MNARFTDDELAAIDANAEKLAEMLSLPTGFGDINTHPHGLALGAETLDTHRMLNQYGARFGRFPGCAEPDPYTLLAIVATYPKLAYPLRNPLDWHIVSPRKFHVNFGCNARLSLDCAETAAWQKVPIKRGQFVVILKMCNPCIHWFYTDEPPARDLSRYIDGPPPDLRST